MALFRIAIFFVACFNAGAVTILTGPTFTPASSAPLAGLLRLTTDVSSRVSIQVNEGTNLWQRDFYNFTTNQSLPLLGFKPGRTNLIQVTVYDTRHNAFAAAQPLRFVTPALPAGFPRSTVLTNAPSLMEPGYTLFVVLNRNTLVGYITIMDNSGRVVWYYTLSQYAVYADQLANGDLIIPYNVNPITEMNMLGQVVTNWTVPSAYPVDIHDAVLTDHGTLLYLSDVNEQVLNFPSSATVSNAPLETAQVTDTPVVEISATDSTLLNAWSPLGLLDPARVSYLTTYSTAVDNWHGNAVIEDTNDDSLIVSLRNQNAVVKFTRDGQIKWILGPPANWPGDYQLHLLTPVGTPFAWNYGQHAPVLTPHGTLLLYDDGNFRASPFAPGVSDTNNYSRAVEYRIDETNMQVSQVWDTQPASEDRLFTYALGKAQWLPITAHVLVTYGFVNYINGVPPSSQATNASMARIIEYTHDAVPKVVFDLRLFDATNTSRTFFGYDVYRAIRIPDLYAHPASPVGNLSATLSNNIPLLKFTADPAHAYEVSASGDLVNWTNIGTATQTETAGQYEFYDIDASESTNRFYRVATQ